MFTYTIHTPDGSVEKEYVYPTYEKAALAAIDDLYLQMTASVDDHPVLEQVIVCAQHTFIYLLKECWKITFTVQTIVN